MHKEGIVTLLFFAVIAVLVVTHATGFASAVTAVGGQTYDETSLLTGSGVTNSGSVTSTGPGNYSIGGASTATRKS